MCRGHFGGQGCTLLRVLQWWEVSQGTPNRPGSSTLHGADIHKPASALRGWQPRCDELCAGLRGRHTRLRVCLPMPGGQCTTQNAAGCSKMAMWENIDIIWSYFLFYASVALNITMAKVSMERPVGLCRDRVSPREVLTNMSAICQPHHRLKSAAALSGGWVSIFVSLCKERSNQNHCPGKKAFRYNN